MIRWVACALLLAAQVSLNQGLQRLLPPVPTSTQEEVSRIAPDLFKALTFGHWTTGIDWMWIRTLADDRISHVAKGTHPQIFYQLDLVSELDPAFFEIYGSGANLLAVVRDDGPGARDLLLKGNEFRKSKLPSYPGDFKQRYWSEAWVIPLLLAYVQLFELNDMPAAAEAFLEASKIPGGPAYLENLARRFEKPGGQYEVGLRLITFMHQNERDERVREELEEKRKSLYLAQYLFHLGLSFEEFKKRQAADSARPLSPERQQDVWKRFLRETGTPSRDPFDGEVSLDESGKVVSSTPHRRVFGLD
jgi:hypothetical protein